MQDTAQLIAIILLAAFAIERALAAAKFALDPVPADNPRARKWREVLLFALGASIALAVVDWGGIRIVERLQPNSPPRLVDYWLTWLVIVAGSDRIRDFLPGSGAAAKETKPVAPPIIVNVEDGKPARIAA